MIDRRDWEEFRNTGLLWWVNRSLHLFGWALVFDYDEVMKLRTVYPARCKFRGFDDITEAEGFVKLTGYLAETMPELLKEVVDHI